MNLFRYVDFENYNIVILTENVFKTQGLGKLKNFAGKFLSGGKKKTAVAGAASKEEL